MNKIYCGDNLDIMQKMESESVDLIYLDPPFFSKQNYEVIWGDGYEERSFQDSEWYRVECPKCGRQVLKADKFCPHDGVDLKEAKITRKVNDEENIWLYIDWMVIRLKEMKRILKPTGSIYLHCDHHAGHYLKVEMDRIFGMKSFKTQISWRRCRPKGNSKSFANNTDYVLYYTKSKNKFTFNTQYGEYKEGTIEAYKHNDNDGKGLYHLDNISAPNGYKYDLGYGEKIPGRGYAWKKETMLEKIKAGLVVIKPGKVPTQKKYLSDAKGVPHDNIWTDINCVVNPIYPTQKPDGLLDRIIISSSNKNDVVFDPFCGCGTTAVRSQKLNRQFIGIDVSPKSCRLIASRINYDESDIIGIPKTTKELHKMIEGEFQQWVCDKMYAKNTSKNPTGGSGGDGGVDGVVMSKYLATVNTTNYKEAPIQVKRSLKVDKNVVKQLYATMQDPDMRVDDKEINHKKGFIVGLSFIESAYKKADSYRKLGVDIELIVAEDLNEELEYFKV